MPKGIISKKLDKKATRREIFLFFFIIFGKIHCMLFEAKIIEFLQSNATVGWIAFFQSFTLLASFIGLLFFAIIIFTKNKKLAIWYVLTFAFTALFNFLIKFLFMRARPFEVYPEIYNYGNESGYSMPSSHSALAAMTAVFIIYLAFSRSKNKAIRGLAIILMSLFICGIGLSRMVLGVHYLTDVLVGMAEGIVIGLIALKIYIKYLKNFIIVIHLDGD